MMKGTRLRDLPHKSNGGSRISKMELSNMFSNFRKGIINDVSTQLDTMQALRKKDKVGAMLAQFCSQCKEKKMNCKSKIFASMDTHPMSTKFE